MSSSLSLSLLLLLPPEPCGGRRGGPGTGGGEARSKEGWVERCRRQGQALVISLGLNGFFDKFGVGGFLRRCCLLFVVRRLLFVVRLHCSFSFVFVVVVIVIIVVVADVVIDVVVAFVFDVNNDYGKV